MTTHVGIELVDIDDATAVQRAAAAVSADGKPRYLRRGDSVVATIEPARRLRRHRAKRVRWPRTARRRGLGSFGPGDPIWNIVGIGGTEAGDPSDIAKYKDDYIAEALEEEFM